MRGKTNWVVSWVDHTTGEESTYGPYTQKQAEETVRRMQRTIAKVAPEYDLDDGEMPEAGLSARWSEQQHVHAWQLVRFESSNDYVKSVVPA